MDRVPVIGFVIAGFAGAVADQVTKSWMLRDSGERRVLSWLRLRPTLGSMPVGSGAGALALWSLAAAGTTTAVSLSPALWGGGVPAAAGLAVGGATSNLVDSFRHGGVVDFVEVARWPAFNLADVAIVVGCGVVVLRAAWGAPS